MNILAIGDIFGLCGVEHTEAVLKGIIQDENIDFCIANGENASGVGMTQRDYDRLTDAGVDVFTMGNHTFGKQDIFKLFEQENNILRPANYPDDVPGYISYKLPDFFSKDAEHIACFCFVVHISRMKQSFCRNTAAV